MAYTKHGHHIPGTSKDEKPPTKVMDCGGPRWCTSCADDAQKAKEDI